jgi:hypothetical protein
VTGSQEILAVAFGCAKDFRPGLGRDESSRNEQGIVLG